MELTDVPKLIVAALLVLSASACKHTPRVEYAPDRGSSYAIRPSPQVDVLEDGPPARRFAETGILKAHTASSDRSIALIKARAAEAGLDGIYAIDCDTQFNGECVAKGFVYVEDARQDAPVAAAEE